jgi:SAM-dependent methyltransferase
MKISQEYLTKMRADWDQRARENARHFIANGQVEWSPEEFYKSGETTVSGDILSDMYNICQGKDPKQMRVLELGCGAGRVTRALAQVFGEVHAVDVSGEMLQQAREALAGSPNILFYQTDGASLEVLGERTFDFAYSCCVFHHISSYDVIRGYVSDIGRRMVPGGLFKFEVQGYTCVQTTLGDTWIGVPFSESQARQMALDCGFELRYHRGAGEERFWLWFFKTAAGAE